MNREVYLKGLRFVTSVVAGSIAAIVATPIVGVLIPIYILVEEGAKSIAIYGVRRFIGGGVLVGMVVGLAFGITELVFYSQSILSVGSYQSFYARASYTVAMHGITAMVLGINWNKNKLGYYISFLIAIAIHVVFNAVIASRQS